MRFKAISVISLSLAMSSGCVYVGADVSQMEVSALNQQFDGMGPIAGTETSFTKTFSLDKLDGKIRDLLTSANLRDATVVPTSGDLNFVNTIEIAAPIGGAQQVFAKYDTATSAKGPDGALHITAVPGVDFLPVVKLNPDLQITVNGSAQEQAWAVDLHFMLSVSAAQKFSF